MTRSEQAVDSPLGASTRFAMELLAWIAAPWAIAQWSIIGAVIVLVVLVVLPARFNVPGDKNIVGHAVSGTTRIAIELLLYASAVAGSFAAWPRWAAAAVALLAVLTVIVGLPRWRWLLDSPAGDGSAEPTGS